MKIIDWIFGNKKQERKPQPSKSVQPMSEDHSIAKAVEKVTNIGLSADALTDVLLEVKYMNEHPCNCGGQWERMGGGSAFPQYVYSDCKCRNCGSEKQFIFYF